MDDLHFGVHQDMMYARNVPAVQGAQWTGVVTQIAIDMLESGKVDAVICVQNDENDRFKPKPVSSVLIAPFAFMEEIHNTSVCDHSHTKLFILLTAGVAHMVTFMIAALNSI